MVDKKYSQKDTSKAKVSSYVLLYHKENTHYYYVEVYPI